MLDEQDEREGEHRANRARARQEELRQRAQNELLHEALTALERGEPLEGVLGQLQHRAEAGAPAGAGAPADLIELEDLLRLAAAVRGLPHPVSQMDWVQQRAVLAARGGLAAKNGRYSKGRLATMSTPPPTRSKTNPPGTAWPVTGPRRAGIWSARGGRTTSAGTGALPSRRPASIFLLGMAVLLMFALSLTGLGLYLSGPAGAQAATLMDAAGQVEVQALAGWQALGDGDRVQSGQRLRTGPASHATLVFFDGTRTTLEPNSDVTLTQVDGDWGRVLRVSLTQNTGLTRHSVVPLRGARSAFTVLTPSGAASVHGTHFDVAVDERGASRFAVDTGRVLVSSEQAEVFLTAGQATAAQRDGALDEPAYQFSLLGRLTASQGSTWIVDGVPFSVTPQTSLTGFDADGPQPGEGVRVAGRVLAGGEWVADRIEPAAPGEAGGETEISTFTGVLESNTGDVWQISGWTVQVDAATEVGADLAAGSPVRATFRLQEDGRWLAVRIESLVDPEDELPATETPGPGPLAQPVLSFSPAELKAEACSAGEMDLIASLVNTALGAENAAENVELAAQVVEGAQYLEWVELDPATIGRIEAGAPAAFHVRLSLKAGWEAAQDGEVKLRVFVLGGSDARLAVKIENECEATEEPQETPEPVDTEAPIVTQPVTPTVTLTPTGTATITVTLPVTPTETLTLPVPPPITSTVPVTATIPTDCTGAQPHPVGLRLAQQYFVRYEELMGWFCQGFGFGEIELAYSLSWVSGKPVAEIFAMKSGGMGWGEIKKLLETRGNPKHWATPPPATPATGSPAVQPTPQPPGNSPGKPGKPPKPPRPNKP